MSGTSRSPEAFGQVLAESPVGGLHILPIRMRSHGGLVHVHKHPSGARLLLPAGLAWS